MRRRRRGAASCASIAAEYLLNLFIRRQVAPGSTLFDDLPLFISDVVARAPPLNFVNEPHEFLLVGRRPGQHTIEKFFDCQ
jgi:hypothetical protein